MTETYPDSKGAPIPDHAAVTYHGSRPADHGEWRFAGPCLCSRCFAAYAMGDPPRYRLTRAGEPRLLHVGAGSITLAAAPDDEECE
jgi:hypothetical protein